MILDWHASEQLQAEFTQPGAGDRRGEDHRYVSAEPRFPLGPRPSATGGVDQIALGERQDAGQRREARVVTVELAFDGGVVGGRVRAVERSQVEHVNQQPRPFDVGEELVPETGAVTGSLDQPRDVGDHELALI